MTLNKAPRGVALVVQGINFDNEEVQHKLNNIGVFEGNTIIIYEKQLTKHTLSFEVNGVSYTLRLEDCDHINVKIKK